MSEPTKPAAPKPAPKPHTAPQKAKAAPRAPVARPKPQSRAAALLGGVIGAALTVPAILLEGGRRGHRWMRERRWRR